MSMVSLLRLKGFGGQAVVSVEVSGQTDRLGSWKAWKRESFQAFWPPSLQAMSYLP